jgi:hypothetical protein
MIRAGLNEFTLGWFIGDFEPSILSSKDFEVGVKFFLQGESEPIHYQRTAVEITLVISGECALAGQLLSAGDILRLEPLEAGDFEAITDCTLVVVKCPSLTQDKVLGDVVGA